MSWVPLYTCITLVTVSIGHGVESDAEKLCKLGPDCYSGKLALHDVPTDITEESYWVKNDRLVVLV